MAGANRVGHWDSDNITAVVRGRVFFICDHKQHSKVVGKEASLVSCFAANSTFSLLKSHELLEYRNFMNFNTKRKGLR